MRDAQTTDKFKGKDGPLSRKLQAQDVTTRPTCFLSNFSVHTTPCRRFPRLDV